MQIALTFESDRTETLGAVVHNVAFESHRTESLHNVATESLHNGTYS